MEDILILGGSGFIGSNIAKAYLLKDNAKITLVDNFSRGSERLSSLQGMKNVEILDLDLTNFGDFDKLGASYDKVYMLAALVGVDKVNKIPHEVVRINTQITMNVLEWAKKAAVGRILFTSTSETYAGTVEAFDVAVPTAENVALCIEDISHPRFSYAVTKMLGEAGFIHYCKAGFFDAVIVRYHNVFGPDMGFRHVIPHLAERFIAQEKPFKIYGHDQTRSFNHIDDAVKGTILALEKGVPGEIYHIGNDEEISIETLTKYVGELFGYEGTYENAPTFAGSVSRRCPDISKAKQDLDYQPSVHWKEGVSETITWYRHQLSNAGSKSESFYDQYGLAQ